jgi:prefoldin alpha subunit
MRSEQPGPSRRPSESEIQAELMRLDLYKNQLTTLTRQHELLMVSLEAHGRAEDALRAMDQFVPDQELMVTVGADTYAWATPRSRERVLVGIGRGLLAEVPRERGLEMLEKRSTRLEESARELLQQIQALDTEMNALQARLQLAVQGEPGRRGAADVGSD